MLGVDLSRGEGLPRGGFVEVVVSIQIPECPRAQGRRGAGVGAGAGAEVWGW